MLNQIEKQFEGFITAMYGKTTISESQEKDIEKTFYAGMLVCHRMMIALNDNEEIALKQLDELHSQINEKIGSLSVLQQ